MTIEEFGRLLFNSLLIITLLKSFIEYIYENKEEIKENWRRY